MFEFIRTHNRLLQFLLLLLILPSFVVFGIQGYSRYADGANAPIAEVDGQKVTQAEWDAAHRQQVESLRQRMPQLDAKLLDSPEARAQTLDVLLRDRVVAAAAQRDHLAVADTRLQRLFAVDPQFEAIRNPDGSINRTLIEAQGMSSEVFAARLRQDLQKQQVLGAITGAPPASKAPAEAAIDALLQRREVRSALFDAATLARTLQPTEEQLAAFHRGHEAQFRAAEQAAIEYVVLDLATIRKGIAVSEDDLRRYYDENAARYTNAEQRRARHILVTAAKDAAADVRQKAKAAAEAILADVRKAPATFADVARAKSQDPGSAAAGGDLGAVSRGLMVKPFEDALFAMKPGEISNVVETEFGYHVLKLEGIEGGQKQPFDQVRPKIEDEVRGQLAQKRWAEAAEQFTNTVYEQSDSLQPVIDKLKLDKRTATVTRTAAPGATGALASAKLLDAVFNADSLKAKRNTEAIDLGANQLVAARVVTHTPARTRTLTEARDEVRQRWAKQQAQALLDKLKGGAPLDALGLTPARVVSRGEPTDLPPQALDAALAVDTVKLPAGAVADLGAAGSALVVVTQVLPRAPNPQAAQSLGEQYQQAWAQAEAGAYLKMLDRRFKVERHPPKPAADAATAASAPPAASR